MSNNIQDVSYKTKNNQNVRKNKGNFRLIAVLMFLAATFLLVAFDDMSKVADRAEAYSSPDKLTEAVREESKKCVSEMTVLECAESTKQLKTNSEIQANEANKREEVINKLFVD